MSISLRDQLLKAGLVNEKQAKQAGKEKQKQQRLAHSGRQQPAVVCKNFSQGSRLLSGWLDTRLPPSGEGGRKAA